MDALQSCRRHTEAPRQAKLDLEDLGAAAALRGDEKLLEQDLPRVQAPPEAPHLCPPHPDRL